MTKPSRRAVERPAGARRLVVEAGRERAHGGEAADAEQADGRLGAAGEHHVLAAVADVQHGVADGVRARRAGAGGGVVRPARAEAHRDLARRHVRDQLRDEERRHARGRPAPRSDGRPPRGSRGRPCRRRRSRPSARAARAAARAPASSIAICAAATAYWMKRSIFFRSLRSMKRSGSKSGTSPATRTGRLEASNRVMARTPERPAHQRLPVALGADPERRDETHPRHHHPSPRAVARVQGASC